MEKNVQTLTMENFSAVYEKFGPLVLRRCRYLLHDEDKALDAMQDVFLRVLEARTKLTEVCSSFFYTTATRVCLNKIRYDSIRVGPSIDALTVEIADNAKAFHEDITDASLVLDVIFDGEKSDTREMAVMHFVDGYTYDEVAEKMHYSKSGVRKRLKALQTRAQKAGK
ncbi:MAG: sigma-70 family RNA polymerase sigma factor [Treponemataceae bacterium]|nr:sigma-70 family RNA polymerase sigma factor [Treponemataceae bacterium]